jgi:hypothetical protein
MQRPASANTVTLGNGKTGYGSGTPNVTPPTTLDVNVLNSVDEEIAGLVETVGMTVATAPDTTYGQLYAAIKKAVAAGALAHRTPLAILTSYWLNAIAVDINWATGNPGDLGGMFVAVGSNSGSGPIIVSSGSLLTGKLSTITTGTKAGTYAGIFYAATYRHTGQHWIIAGSLGEIETVATDPTGTWTKRTQAGAFAGTFYGAADNGTTAVVVGTSGEIQSSEDLATWTHRTADNSFSGTFYSVRWSVGLGMFVAVGSSGEIQTSTDGHTWTHRTCGSSYSGDFKGVYAGLVGGVNGLVAVGLNHEIQTSTNGTAWTRRATLAGTDNYAFTSVVYLPGPGLWVAGGLSYVRQCAMSFDGINWGTGGADNNLPLIATALAPLSSPMTGCATNQQTALLALQVNGATSVVLSGFGSN